jgi:hypothetical protein
MLRATGNRAANEGMMQADVIRWTEGIYEQCRRKSAKARRVGEGIVTAEVIETTDDDWLKLLARMCGHIYPRVAHWL